MDSHTQRYYQVVAHWYRSGYGVTRRTPISDIKPSYRGSKFPRVWHIVSDPAYSSRHAGKRSDARTVQAAPGWAADCHTKSRDMAICTHWSHHGTHHWRDRCRFYRHK